MPIHSNTYIKVVNKMLAFLPQTIYCNQVGFIQKSMA